MFKRMIMVLVVLILGGSTVFGSSINVSVEGKKMDFDVPPVLENGRTLVPLRAIFEELGADIQWEAETKTITATKGETTISLQIGNGIAHINENEVVMDVPAKVFNGRTMVPVRFVSEAMGAVVGWEGSTKTVTIEQAQIYDRELKRSEKWTEDEGPYIIEDGFVVQNGVTLEIEPGTAILVKSNEVSVYGMIKALGVKENKIRWNSQGVDSKIMVKGSDGVFDNVISNMSVEMTKAGNTEVINSEFKSIEVEFSPNVKVNNNVLSGELFGVRIYESDGIEVIGNTISNTGTAVHLKMCKDSEVVSNSITQSKSGIVSNSNYNSMFIENEISTCSEYGIRVENASYGNQYYHNNMSNNNMNAIAEIGEKNISMFDNYWGVHKVEQVGETIDDFNDDYNLTEIQYDPILTEPYSK